MAILDTAVDHRDRAFLEARAAMLAALGSLEAALDAAREGGGERAVTRHHARGRLLPRERIELLVDRDSPLLELSPVAGWGTGAPVGAAVVTAVGVVEGQLCLIIADDPTVPTVPTGPTTAGGVGVAAGAGTLRKVLRAQEIALANGLPVVSLAEATIEPAVGSPGYSRVHLTESPYAIDQPEIVHHAGKVAAGFARLAAARIPTVGVFFGQLGATAGAGAFDHTIALVRPAGGTPAPAQPADHLAEDERDALRLARQCAHRFPAPPPVRPAGLAAAPKHDPEDLLGVPVGHPREILGRVLDGSAFDEVQAGYGEALCTGWGEVHGYPVAVLADATSPAGPGATGPSGTRAAEADKAVRFVRLAARAGTPLLFLQHGTAPPGGSAVPAAVAAAGVPLLTVRVGSWRGPAPVPALARFRFAWPRARVTLSDGGSPLAGGGSPLVGIGSAAAAGGDEVGSALALSGWLDDDGVIDPRDTRTVLGMCLSVVRS